MSVRTFAVGMFVFLVVASSWVWAEEKAKSDVDKAIEEELVVQEEKGIMEYAFIAIGSALAVGFCGLATALAQARIGAAGAGAIAENPKLAGTIIVLVAIPETMVILGFVIAFMLISKL